MFRTHHHDTLDSTNERALAELRAGTARHGDVHVAAAQTAGRGRQGRRWESPRGEGLYLSAVLLPPAPPPHPAGLTMAAGLAVHDAVRQLGLCGARLEWPNDLCVGAAKLCGILVEAPGLSPSAPAYVIGIGLNVRQRAFPAELCASRAVTSLALLGLDVALASAESALLGALATRLDELAGAPARTTADYLAALELCGRRVRARSAERQVVGTLVGLTFADGLLLTTDAGAGALRLEHVVSLDPL